MFRGYLFERFGKLLGTGAGSENCDRCSSAPDCLRSGTTLTKARYVQQAVITVVSFSDDLAVTGRI